MEPNIDIQIESLNLTDPITVDIAHRAVQILNTVFRSIEFKNSLLPLSFFSSNRPGFAKHGLEITGAEVYEDFSNRGRVFLKLIVKDLRNPWKRFLSKTKGETNPNGNTITTYTWWLQKETTNDLLLEYATHVGHEIFHTKYFKYIHDPGFGSRKFVNEKDVSYKIDDILESLISAQIKAI